jgi:hypothetical protein
MSRFVRIEVDVETLVDELHAYVTDPPAVRRTREYAVLRELGGPSTYVHSKYGVWSKWPYPVLHDALRLNWEVLAVMRLDGVCAREDVASFVAWSLSERVTPRPLARPLRSAGVHRERDRAAVAAALELPWSNGQAEGQVTRLI